MLQAEGILVMNTNRPGSGVGFGRIYGKGDETCTYHSRTDLIVHIGSLGRHIPVSKNCPCQAEEMKKVRRVMTTRRNGIGVHAKAETRCGLGGASNTIDCPLYVLEDNRSGPGRA